MTTTSIHPVVIREASRADLAGITTLLATNDLPTTGVAESLDGFFVGESAGQIVGVVGLETCCDRYALLRSTAVAPDWRGRGLGRRLVERAIGFAEAQGFQALYLLTTTAEQYFPTFGFATIAREDVPAEVRATEEFTSACPASAAVMKRTLVPR